MKELYIAKNLIEIFPLPYRDKLKEELADKNTNATYQIPSSIINIIHWDASIYGRGLWEYMYEETYPTVSLRKRIWKATGVNYVNASNYFFNKSNPQYENLLSKETIYQEVKIK